MSGFIWMLIIGLIVGALAKLVMPGHDPGGVFVTMLLGVAGAVVAGFVGRLQAGHLEEERFAAERRDFGRHLVDLVRDARDVRKDAGALLQVERAQPLQLSPDRHSATGRLRWHAIHQHQPARNLHVTYP